MKACVLEKPYDVRIKELPIPEPKDDEVLLRVTVTLSNLQHGDHSVIMTSSDHSELDKISISLSEFPQCEVYFFISSHLFC